MKNIELTKRLMAFLSATTIALTMSGCSEEDKKNDNTSTTTSIISEFDDSTSQPSNSTTTSTESDEKESNESQNVTTEVETSSKTEDTTSKTDPTSKPSNNTTSQSQTSTSTPQNSSSTPSSSSQSTTSKPSNTKVEKLTQSNINDVAAIDVLADSAHRHMYSVNNLALYTYISYTYDGKNYTCDKDEFRMFITLLNEESLSKDTLKELFGDMSLDDIERCSRIFSYVSYAFCNSDMTIDYDKFVVDSNTRSFLNEFQNKVKNYMATGNIEEFNKFVVSFYEDKNLRVNHKDNLVIDNYVSNLLGYVSTLYDNTELDYFVTVNVGDTGIYNSYVTGEFYQKTRNNQLTR